MAQAPAPDTAPLPSSDAAAPRLRLVGKRTVILIPCLDEAPRIAGLVHRLHELYPELDVLVVDDGSSDGTADEADAAGADVLRHPYNLGYGAALQTGYKYALEQGYERLVQMDGDGQHPPEEVSTLLNALEESGANLLIGSRFLGTAAYRIPRLRLVGIRLFGRLTGWLVHRRVTDPTSGLQAMDREVLHFYQQDFYPWDYPDADMLLRVHYAGFRCEEVPVTMLGGPPGKSMHRGMRPLYYVYKLFLSLALTALSGPEDL
ncbi:MAG: glycosyltransferase family 2 protein [Proteobacteria bacterium]|nr:glycosyltransferase family 2 protein [Pseudomonadota bacterium]